MDIKENTILKYNQFLNNLPDNKHLYQINSINNFLLHIDEIKNENDKEKVFCLLNEYLDYVSAHSITRTECKELYFEYIHPIGSLYVKHASFRLLFHYRPVAVVLLLINLLLFLFSIKVLVIILINVIGLSIVLYLLKISKTTRVFGINW